MNGTPKQDKTDRELKELELLVARCQLGEPDGFAALVERWHRPLWRYVRTMPGDPDVAEEILQEGWLRILRGIDRLQSPSRLQAWLYSIVRRTFMDMLRVRYAHSGVEPVDAELPDTEPPAELGWEETETLYTSLQALPPPDRETIVLFYLRELDLQEVSEVLDIPVGTVKSRLHRARRFLRNELEEQGVSR